MKFLSLCSLLLLLGVGCRAQPTARPPVAVGEPYAVTTAVLPIEEYIARRTFKVFGEYYSDRFTGYHVGDDIEFVDVVEEVSVWAIMDGTVVRIGEASGYGGVVLIDHGGVNAIYGHIDLASSTLAVGDTVELGQFIANLGDGASEETDGERKHLHFGLYTGEPGKVSGYVGSEADAEIWIDPQEFFTSHGIEMTE